MATKTIPSKRAAKTTPARGETEANGGKKTRPSGGKTANLMVRVDPTSKTCIGRAAALRRLSTSDYVRTVIVAQAEREVREAEHRVIALAPAEQEAFWQALQEPAQLTERQRELGRLMRGEV